MTGIFITVQVAYLLGLIVLASISYSKTGTVKEFLVMGRSAGAFLAGTAYFATQFSMSSLVGVPGEIYSIGFAGLGIILSVAMLSMAFGVLVAGGRLQALSRKLELLTLPDYLAARYHSDLVRLLCAVAIIVFQVPYLAAQVVGAGVISNVFTGAPYEVGAVAMGVIVIAYCMAGGMRATIFTDALQGILMVTSAIAIFVAVAAHGGGLSHIMAQMAARDPGAMSFPGHPVAAFPWKQYVSQILLWTVFSIGQPQLVNKYLVAKDYGALVKGSIFSGVAMTVTCVTVWTAGAMASVVAPGIDKPDWVMPTLLATCVSPFIASLFQAGILSAGMSTVSSLLVVVGGAFSRDIYQKLLHREASDRRVLWVSRVMVVAVGVVVLALAVARPATIFRMVLFAWSGTGILAIPIVAGLYWKRPGKEAAMASIIAGIATLLLLTFRFPAAALGFHPIVVSALVSLAALVVVSLAASPARNAPMPACRPVGWVFAVIFAALYGVVWLPHRYIFPWQEYVPGFFGVPAFVWVWLAIQAIAGTALRFYLKRARHCNAE